MKPIMNSTVLSDILRVYGTTGGGVLYQCTG
jgi:hypothetical protein